MTTPPRQNVLNLAGRALVGVRLALIGGAAIVAVGIVGSSANVMTLASTVGPTSYVFAAHPHTEVSRFKNSIIGHSAGIAAGLASLAMFGLWDHPSVVAQSGFSYPQVGACAVALALTLVVLELAGAHHSPAAATTLVVATGLASPGRPLLGLVVGLAVVIIVGPPLGKLPFQIRRAAQEQAATPARDA